MEYRRGKGARGVVRRRANDGRGTIHRALPLRRARRSHAPTLGRPAAALRHRVGLAILGRPRPSRDARPYLDTKQIGQHVVLSYPQDIASQRIPLSAVIRGQPRNGRRAFGNTVRRGAGCRWGSRGDGTQAGSANRGRGRVRGRSLGGRRTAWPSGLARYR
jgi:hypothetical protein